jgi:hypothetical protein
VAERNATIHAAGTLLLQRLVGKMNVEFIKIFDPLQRWSLGGRLSFKFQKTSWLAHTDIPSKIGA